MSVDLESWKHMWTTEKHNYWLVSVTVPGRIRHVIFYIPTNADLIIEDEAVATAIINKMIEHNVKQVSSDEFSEYLRSQLDPEYLKALLENLDEN